ncbi:MAG: glycosyltransferase [Clostridia bacterium]|nr:glycosyltransferase [Deltaproteobacteria bacterium]
MTTVALIHDWLITHRGGEQVLLEIARAFPSAPIYTLVCARDNIHSELAHREIHTSFVQHLPRARDHFRRYLPLFPKAIEAFDLRKYKVVISTSHCVAKGAKAHNTHISYIHTPMRYIWDQLPSYVPHVPGRLLLTKAAEAAVRPLKRWDVESSKRPTALVANSQYVRERIARVWNRESLVVHPPVAVDFWRDAPELPREGYLVVSALVPYKRVEIAVDAAVAYGFPLTVIGAGSELARLEQRGRGHVRFITSSSNEELRRAYASARALLFCGVEDFGIVPVEAQAAGCPVIAFSQGGALETVVDGVTGAFFSRPSVEGLAEAIERFETMNLDRAVLTQHAETFSTRHFHQAFQSVLREHGVLYETVPMT